MDVEDSMIRWVLQVADGPGWTSEKIKNMKNSITVSLKKRGVGLFTGLMLGLCTFVLLPGAQAQVAVFSNLWSVAAGTYPDLPTAGNNVRGVAISPITTNVLFGSTTQGTNNGGNHVTVLDGANNGALIGQLSGSGVGGGTLNLIAVRVSDDGSVYACNLSGAPASNLKIYRWASETNLTDAPLVVFESGAGTSFQYRVGDWMDVRGSGTNTELLLCGSTTSGVNISTNFLIFRPTDETLGAFTNISISFPNLVARGSHGIAFEGTNNALYAKLSGSQTVTRIAYNPDTLTAQVTASFNLDQSASPGLDYAEINGVKLLSAVCAATAAVTNGLQHKVKVFQLTSASNYVIVLDNYLPFPNFANGNGIGMTDIKNGRLVASEPNNGINCYAIHFVTNTPPNISGGGQPSGGTIIEGYNYTFRVTPSGTAPLSYQWYFNDTNLIAGANGSSYTVSGAGLSAAGGYRVVVTNLYGSATSSVANLNLLPGRYSGLATTRWSLAPGSRDYVTSDNTQRGMALDPVSGNLVVVSRAPTNGVHLLNSATGADIGDLDQSSMGSIGTPGTFAMNIPAVADDGVLFVCNLITSGASDSFAIYRWDTATLGAYQGIAYYGNPAIGRLGDTFIARGSAMNTELLGSFRTGTNVALFTTADGYNYLPSVIAITNLPADAVANGFAGLGIAWGPGKSFWAKSSGFKLRRVEYDLASLTGWVVAEYDAANDTMYPIAVDNANGLLMGIGAGETPQNLEFFDLLAAGGPLLIDREVFPTTIANGNGTGSVVVDVPGGRFFALDTNNGLVAGDYIPLLRYSVVAGKLVVSWAGPAKLYSSSTVNGTYTEVTGATSPYTSVVNGAVYYRLKR